MRPLLYIINMYYLGGTYFRFDQWYSDFPARHINTLGDVLRLRNRVSASFLRLKQLDLKPKL